MSDKTDHQSLLIENARLSRENRIKPRVVKETVYVADPVDKEERENHKSQVLELESQVVDLKAQIMRLQYINRESSLKMHKAKLSNQSDC